MKTEPPFVLLVAAVLLVGGAAGCARQVGAAAERAGAGEFRYVRELDR